MAVEDTIACTVITPEAKIYEGKVAGVILPAHDGEIGVLKNRAPLLCKLGPGRLRLRTEGAEQTWYIDAGFAQVAGNEVTVLTQKAMRPEEIKREEAEALLAEARGIVPKDEILAERRSQMEARARAQLRIGR